ncbi:MAG: ribosomal L7Ae/L30e/S12e/Gadd45 family protein [Candidatus Nanohaloarchaea archaeon]|nr:ribosomal L7Ae/L30e/S12e/Gadd45 family protein [Candidatus Nanohaloarchaea archaeon]
MSVREHVQEASQEDRVVVGTKETLKHVDELEEVVIASNTPDGIVADVEEAAETNDVDVEVFDGSNADLGSLCGRPFAATTIGIREASTTTL